MIFVFVKREKPRGDTEKEKIGVHPMGCCGIWAWHGAADLRVTRPVPYKFCASGGKQTGAVAPVAGIFAA